MSHQFFYVVLPFHSLQLLSASFHLLLRMSQTPAQLLVCDWKGLVAANNGHHRGLRPIIKVCCSKCMSYVYNQISMELNWVSCEALTYCWGSKWAFSAGSLRRFCIFLFSLLKLAACKIKCQFYTSFHFRDRDEFWSHVPTWLWDVSAPLWALLSRSVWKHSPPVQPHTSSEPDFVSLHCRQQISQTSSRSLYSEKKRWWQMVTHSWVSIMKVSTHLLLF